MLVLLKPVPEREEGKSGGGGGGYISPVIKKLSKLRVGSGWVKKLSKLS